MQKKFWSPGTKNLLMLACALIAAVICLKVADVALAQRATDERGAPVVTEGPEIAPPIRGGNDNKGGNQKQEMTVGYSYKNDVSPPLRKMKPLPIRGGSDNEPVEKNKNPKTGVLHVNSYDPVVQSNFIASLLQPDVMPAPVLNFDGIGFPGVSCNCAPPDTNGEVGLTQYVQMVNAGYQVFNKSTGASVLGPAGISTIWTGFGGFCETGGAGDPVVMYDQIANRWVITQFAGTSSLITDECIAVSATSDATGTYNRYGFHLGSNFFDYPHLGVWPDGYYMSMNIFNAAGTAFLGPQAFVFDRVKMIAGQPATFITPGITGGASEDGFLPADFDGPISSLPPAGAPATFIEAPFSNTYRVFHFHADFTTPANSTFTLFQAPAAAPFTELCGTTRACVPQGGTTNKVDGIGDRLLFRLAYRNYGAYESVVGNMTVANAGVAGIRWFELRGVSNGPVTVFQESTYQPDTTWRWMGSVAQDISGNMALGFSASDGTIKPQIRYAGRLKTDPLNVLTQGENTLFAGGGAQTGTLNRWGDYSDLTVDPVDDCTFWYTQEYIPTDGTFNWKTRIGNFKFPSCTAGPTGTAHFVVTAAFDNSALAGAGVAIDGNPIGTTNASGLFDVTLPVGPHSYAVSKVGYTTANGNTTIVTGVTTNIPVSLASVPVIASGGAPVITAESCSVNNTIDPGETVTVSLPVTNSGGVGSSTTSLVGTLLATGGVTNPSAPQTYGAVAAGATVSRSFTFTASAALQCGAPITISLQLQDGASNLGTVTYGLNAGSLQTTLSQNFDGVTVPNLPAGWTATNVVGAAPLWVTTATGSDTAPNNAFVDDPAALSDKVLDSPTIAIPAGGATFSFRHNFATENTFDGGVLEISIGGGAFADIVTAGGSFGTGGYNGTISTSFSSPIAGRAAWTGSSGGYITTTVNLPPAAKGQNVKLRWRMASDTSVAATGWHLDGVSMTSYVCCGAPANIQSGGVPPITFDSGANGKMDPGELVTVNLTLVNFGGSPTTNATARLQTGGGVVSVVGTNPQSYGVLAGGGPLAAPDASATKPFTFRVDPQLACGSNVTLTFALADGATSFGTASYVFQTGTAGAIATSTFSNATPITINDLAPATPYPSNITVSGLTGNTSTVKVTLNGLSHTFPADIDMLLVSPTGQKYIFFSDTGGTTAVTNVNVTLDDAAAAAVPSPVTTGSFKPTNTGANDAFALPAPPAPYLNAAPGGTDTFASSFGGFSPNGTWSLYVVDDSTGNVGTISGGWSLAVTTQAARTCQAPTAANVNVSGRVLTSDGAGLRNATVTLTDGAGRVRTATTSAFGFYLFTDVEQGSYVVGVSSRRFVYQPRPLVINDTLSDVDFWPNQ